MALTRGFTGRRRGTHDPRLPPGQYDANMDWPVLHVEPTPSIDTAGWSFEIDGLIDKPVRWSWDEIHALPASRYEGAIHCVTTWSKFGMRFDGVSVDTLLDVAGVSDDAAFALARSHTGYTTNFTLEDLTGGKEWVSGLTLFAEDQRGFWEQRGYHYRGDPWLEQRYQGDS
jgi:DMSO/TMAO reductase YedYZ molybdopterin-dependent catalytic subunit